MTFRTTLSALAIATMAVGAPVLAFAQPAPATSSTATAPKTAPAKTAPAAAKTTPAATTKAVHHHSKKKARHIHKASMTKTTGTTGAKTAEPTTAPVSGGAVK